MRTEKNGGASSALSGFDDRKSTLKLNDSASPLKVISDQRTETRKEMGSQTKLAIAKLGKPDESFVNTFSHQTPGLDLNKQSNVVKPEKVSTITVSRNNLISTDKD